jgi:hypothetical protein
LLNNAQFDEEGKLAGVRNATDRPDAKADAGWNFSAVYTIAPSIYSLRLRRYDRSKEQYQYLHGQVHRGAQ